MHGVLMGLVGENCKESEGVWSGAGFVGDTALGVIGDLSGGVSNLNDLNASASLPLARKGPSPTMVVAKLETVLVRVGPSDFSSEVTCVGNGLPGSGAFGGPGGPF